MTETCSENFKFDSFYITSCMLKSAAVIEFFKVHQSRKTATNTILS